MVHVVKDKEDWDSIMERAKAQGKVVIVDFYADWCGPCKVIAPLFAQLAADNPDMIFLKLDVDTVEAVASEVGVSAMPTFMVFKDGVKVAEQIGAAQEKLKALVNAHK